MIPDNPYLVQKRRQFDNIGHFEGETEHGSPSFYCYAFIFFPEKVVELKPVFPPTDPLYGRQAVKPGVHNALPGIDPEWAAKGAAGRTPRVIEDEAVRLDRLTIRRHLKEVDKRQNAVSH